jgi:hypothetical protein
MADVQQDKYFSTLEKSRHPERKMGDSFTNLIKINAVISVRLPIM